MDKNKIIIIGIAIIIVAIIVGYAYWKNKNKPVIPPTTATVGIASTTESTIKAAESAAQSATQGVLPSIGGAKNPLENKPVVNPVEVSNPFKSVKTNPFQ